MYTEEGRWGCQITDMVIYTISSYMNKLVVQFQIFLYDAVDLGVFSSLSPSVVRSAGRGGGEQRGKKCV